jgi:sugar phosphate isomerase/epimerase
MKIAAQLYTVREFMKTPEQIVEGLKKIKSIGYNAVQVSGIGPIEPEKLKEIADREGLVICATHNRYEDLRDKTDEVIAKHKLWQCRYAGIGSLPKPLRGSNDGFIQFAKEAASYGKKLKDAGLQLIYHNHNFEFIRYNGIRGMDILLNESDSNTFDFEIDVYWVQAGGADPIDWIRKLEGRMKVIHLKDAALTPEKEWMFAEVGEGNMNWHGIIDACQDIGIEWGVVEQDRCMRNPFESLEISLINLMKLGLKS